MSTDTLIAVIVVLIGPAVGSFLGVLVERLPKGRSLLEPSSCDECGTRLAWRNMAPIVSAILQEHRCAFCGVKFPKHLIRIEIASLLASIMAVFLSAGSPAILATALVLWCLVGLFYSDLLYLRLPDVLTVSFFVLSLFLVFVQADRTVTEAFVSGIGAAGFLWLVRWLYFLVRGREGMGLGDVKLTAGIGALLGWQLVPLALLVASGMALLIAYMDYSKTRSRSSLDAPIPFGSYLVGATVLVFLL